MYLEHILKCKLESKFTSPKPRKFGPYTLDVFCPAGSAAGNAYEFLGCLMHYHESADCPNMPSDIENVSCNALGVPFVKLARDRLDRD